MTDQRAMHASTRGYNTRHKLVEAQPPQTFEKQNSARTATSMIRYWVDRLFSPRIRCPATVIPAGMQQLTPRASITMASLASSAQSLPRKNQGRSMLQEDLEAFS